MCSVLLRDVHCGRIQCQGGNERPLLGSNAEILTTTVKLNQSDFTCRGAYFYLGDDVSDPAMVSQGTACGPNKVSIHEMCLFRIVIRKFYCTFSVINHADPLLNSIIRDFLTIGRELRSVLLFVVVGGKELGLGLGYML